MERQVKEPNKLQDGLHSGIIVGVEERTQPYNYIDLVIQPDGADMKMKAGYPDFLCETSKLGQLLKRFGYTLNKGENVNLQSLKDKAVVFITMTKPGKDGNNYANIVTESVKPKPTGDDSQNGTKQD